MKGKPSRPSQSGPLPLLTVISRRKYSILRSVLPLFTVTLLVASATPRMSLYPGVVMLVY